jgi:hypothetical protein
MQISVAIAGERFPGERDADHRQASGLPWSRVCRMAPASGLAQSSPDRAVLRGLDWGRLPKGEQAASVGPCSVAIGTRRTRCRSPAADRVARGQGCVGWRPLRALLNRRPIGRFFVVSIEEGSHKANRLPASGRARWPSAPGERDADHRQPIGLPVVKSVPAGASVGPCSVAIAGERCQVERDADHRQPIGLPVVKGVPAGARFGPCSVAIGTRRTRFRSQWPSRASGGKVEGDAGQRQAIGLPVVKGVPDGARVGPCSIVARSGGSSWSRLRKAPARRTGCQRRAVLGGHRRQVKGDADHRQPIGLPVVKGVSDGARVGPCSIVARSGGSSWSRLRKAPARRTGCQLRAVLGGHRHQANAMQITGSRSGCPWSRVCRMAPAAGRAQWRSRASGAKVEGDAGQRQAIGLPVVKGVPDGARFGACSVAIAGERCQGRRRCRSPAADRAARGQGRAGWRPRRAVLSGHRGRAVPRSKAMQGSGSRSGCPWSRVCRMALASGRAQSSPDQPVLRGLD